STTPLEEWRSTISIESPTLIRACRLESIGSAIRMSRSPSRPTTLEPDGSGNSRPASGPESTRSRATAAPRDSERVAYSVDDRAIETTLPERSPAWIRSTSRSSERTPFAPGPAPGSWTWRVRPSGASASPRSGSAWYSALATSATVAVASAVTSRSVSRSSGLRSVSLMRIGAPPPGGRLARLPVRPSGAARPVRGRQLVVVPCRSRASSGQAAAVSVVVRGLGLLQQRQVVGGDQAREDGVLDQASPPVAGELARASAQPAHPEPVELVADVVQLAVELRQLPSQPLRGLCRGGHGAHPGALAHQHRLGEREDQQLLARGELHRAHRRLPHRV